MSPSSNKLHRGVLGCSGIAVRSFIPGIRASQTDDFARKVWGEQAPVFKPADTVANR